MSIPALEPFFQTVFELSASQVEKPIPDIFDFVVELDSFSAARFARLAAANGFQVLVLISECSVAGDEVAPEKIELRLPIDEHSCGMRLQKSFIFAAIELFLQYPHLVSISPHELSGSGLSAMKKLVLQLAAMRCRRYYAAALRDMKNEDGRKDAVLTYGGGIAIRMRYRDLLATELLLARLGGARVIRSKQLSISTETENAARIALEVVIEDGGSLSTVSRRVIGKTTSLQDGRVAQPAVVDEPWLKCFEPSSVTLEQLRIESETIGVGRQFPAEVPVKFFEARWHDKILRHVAEHDGDQSRVEMQQLIGSYGTLAALLGNSEAEQRKPISEEQLRELLYGIFE